MTDEPHEAETSIATKMRTAWQAARTIGINPHAATAIFRGPVIIMNSSWADQLSRQDSAYAHVTEQIFKKLETFTPEQLKAAQTLGLLMA